MIDYAELGNIVGNDNTSTREARLIMNRDATTIEVLKKVKAIVDPENIMNPGKLCF